MPLLVVDVCGGQNVEKPLLVLTFLHLWMLSKKALSLFVFAKIATINDRGSLEKCGSQIERVLDYTQNQFLKDVKTSPAILSYVTSGMNHLNIEGNFPRVPSKVESIRGQLLVLKSDQENYLQNLLIGQQKNLPGLDLRIAKVKENIKTIASNASFCYDYRTKTESVDWGLCYSAFSRIQSQLHKVSSEHGKVNLASISSNKPLGLVVTNPYDKTIELAVTLDKNSRWADRASSPKRDYVDFKGENYDEQLTNCISSSCITKGVKGATYVEVKGSKQTLTQGQSFKLYPGESLLFGRIDTFEGYKDNVGSINLYWTCLDCSSDMKKKSISKLNVQANSANGTYFKNVVFEMENANHESSKQNFASKLLHHTTFSLHSAPIQ